MGEFVPECRCLYGRKTLRSAVRVRLGYLCSEGICYGKEYLIWASNVL